MFCLHRVRRKLNVWKKKLLKDIKTRDYKIMKMQEERISVMEKVLLCWFCSLILDVLN